MIGMASENISRFQIGLLLITMSLAICIPRYLRLAADVGHYRLHEELWRDDWQVLEGDLED
jgi:hypothetical protein